MNEIIKQIWRDDSSKREEAWKRMEKQIKVDNGCVSERCATNRTPTKPT